MNASILAFLQLVVSLLVSLQNNPNASPAAIQQAITAASQAVQYANHAIGEGSSAVEPNLESTSTIATNITTATQGVCEYATPPQGCQWQGGSAYPVCGAQLVCGNNNATTTMPISLTPGSFTCTTGYKVSADGTSCVTGLTTAFVIVNDTAINPSGSAASPGVTYAVPGQTVYFDNTGSQTHELVADDGSFDTGVLSTSGAGAQYTQSFSSAGMHTFHDKNNPSLTGTLIISNGVQGSSDFLNPTTVNGYTNYNSASAAASFVSTPASCGTSIVAAQVGHYAIIPNLYIYPGATGAALSMAKLDVSTLPPGLTGVVPPDPIEAGAGGQIVAGVPTQAGVYNVLDTSGDKMMTITVVNSGDDLSGYGISNNVMPIGRVGSFYSPFAGPIFQSDASANPTNYWKIVLGNLPSGISFNSATGQFSGTPTTPGLSQMMIFEYSAAGKILGELEVGILIYSQNNHGYGNCVGSPVFGASGSSSGAKTGYDLGSYPAGTSVPATFIGTNLENIRNDAGQVVPPYFPGIYQYFISTFASMNNPTINAMMNSSQYPGNMEGNILLISNGFPAGDQGIYNFTVQGILYPNPVGQYLPAGHAIASATIPFSMTITAPGTTATPTTAAIQPFAISCTVSDKYVYNSSLSEELWQIQTSGHGVVSDPGNPPAPDNSAIKVMWSGDPSVTNSAVWYHDLPISDPLTHGVDTANFAYDAGYSTHLTDVYSSSGYSTLQQYISSSASPSWSGSAYHKGDTVIGTVTATNQYGEVAKATCADVLGSLNVWTSRSSQLYNGQTVLHPLQDNYDGQIPANPTCPVGYVSAVISGENVCVSNGTTHISPIAGTSNATSFVGTAQSATSGSFSSSLSGWLAGNSTSNIGSGGTSNQAKLTCAAGPNGAGFIVNSDCMPAGSGESAIGVSYCNTGTGIGIPYVDPVSHITTCLNNGPALAGKPIYITGETPVSGPIGTVITVAGVGFSATGNVAVIDSGDAVVPATTLPNGQIQFTFPATEKCTVVSGGPGSDGNGICPFMSSTNITTIIPNLPAPYSTIPFPTISTYYARSSITPTFMVTANKHTYQIKNSNGAISASLLTTFTTTGLAASSTLSN